MRRLIVFTAFLWLALPAGPTAAQTSSADTIGAAHELIAVMRAADHFKALFPLIVQQLKPAIVQNRPAVEKEYDAIMPLMIAEANARINEVLDQLATVYAKNFSAAELRDITAFYRTPTGQKMVEKTSEIAQQSSVIGQQFGQALASSLQQRIIDELRKRGHNI